MSHSTDEDDQRILRSGKIGVVESEGEGILLHEAGQESHEGESELTGVLLQEAGQESQEEESAAESRLIIAESSGEEEVMESLAGLESQCAKRGSGFGEIDNDDCSDDTGSESASNNGSSDSDDAGSMHSTGSDARHDLDYLCDLEGKLLSEMLVAS